MRIKDEKKRMDIYMGALKVITEKGMAGASMSKIAREAGVSPATIYVYFTNKEDMLGKLYLMVKKQLAEYIFEGFDSQMSADAMISSYMTRLFEFMTSHPLHFSFHEQFYDSPLISEEIKIEAARGYEPLLEVYTRELAAERIRPVLPQLVSAFLIYPILALIKEHLEGETEVTDEVLDSAISMVKRAVLM